MAKRSRTPGRTVRLRCNRHALGRSAVMQQLAAASPSDGVPRRWAPGARRRTRIAGWRSDPGRGGGSPVKDLSVGACVAQRGASRTPTDVGGRRRREKMCRLGAGLIWPLPGTERCTSGGGNTATLGVPWFPAALLPGTPAGRYHAARAHRGAQAGPEPASRSRRDDGCDVVAAATSAADDVSGADVVCTSDEVIG